MTCHRCANQAYKIGIQNGFQRWRCKECKRTFSDIPPRPLDEMRVDPAKGFQVVALLAEGVGVRAIERLTSLNRRTVLGILKTAGEKCYCLLDQRIHNIKAEQIQADEIHSFVLKKQFNVEDGEDDSECGDFFTYLGIDRESKLIISFRTGKRTADTTAAFLIDLKRRIPSGCQLTTDAFKQYCSPDTGVAAVFGDSINYATETKYFGKPSQYIPRQVIGISRKRRIGNPDLEMATTCHAERTNLSVRLFTRRFTRCTLGYSKTVKNLRLAVALFIAHFNFCRKHSALDGRTPAMAAGLTDHAWTIEELLNPTLASWLGSGWIGKDLQP